MPKQVLKLTLNWTIFAQFHLHTKHLLSLFMGRVKHTQINTKDRTPALNKAVAMFTFIFIVSRLTQVYRAPCILFDSRMRIQMSLLLKRGRLQASHGDYRCRKPLKSSKYVIFNIEIDVGNRSCFISFLQTFRLPGISSFGGCDRQSSVKIL